MPARTLISFALLHTNPPALGSSALSKRTRAKQPVSGVTGPGRFVHLFTHCSVTHKTNSSLQHAQEKNVCLTCVSHVTRPPFCSRWGGDRIACLRWHGPCGIDGARLQQTSRGSHAPKLYVHPASSIWQTGSHCDTGLLALLSFMFEQYKCCFGWSCLERRAFEAGITERVPAFPHTRRSLPVKKEPCTWCWQQYALQTIVAIVSSEVR